MSEEYRMPLTKEERSLIVKSWDGMSDHAAFAHSLFLNVFSMKPQIMKMFGCESEPAEKLKDNLKLRTHTTNFVNYITLIVSIAMDPTYWDLMTESIVQNILQECPADPFCSNEDKAKLGSAWRRLMTYVVEEMKLSYTAAAFRQTSRRGRSASLSASDV